MGTKISKEITCCCCLCSRLWLLISPYCHFSYILLELNVPYALSLNPKGAFPSILRGFARQFVLFYFDADSFEHRGCFLFSHPSTPQPRSQGLLSSQRTGRRDTLETKLAPPLQRRQLSPHFHSHPMVGSGRYVVYGDIQCTDIGEYIYLYW